MAINLLQRRYNVTTGDDHDVPGIPECNSTDILSQYLDKRRGNIKWHIMRRAMRVFSDKLNVDGLRSPNCDEAVTKVIDNFPELRSLTCNIDVRYRIGKVMIKNRVERIRAEMIRKEKGGPRRYKRKIGAREIIRWKEMRVKEHAVADRHMECTASLPATPTRIRESTVPFQNAVTEDNLQETMSTSESLATTREVLYGAGSPSLRRSPRGLSVSPVKTPSPAKIIANTPTHSTPETPAGSNISSSPPSPDSVQNPGTKGWKGWVLLDNEIDLVANKKFKPKEGPRKRKPNRRLLDL